jgi:hypothetical protein
MDRTETKCADLKRYAAKAGAQAEAERKTHYTNLKHLAYPCECGGYHCERIDPLPLTPNQQAIAALEEACGHDKKTLDAVLVMRKREMDKYHKEHVPRRRVAVA